MGPGADTRRAESPSEPQTRIVFRTDAGATAEIEAACRALHAHHGHVAPTMAGLPVREADLCWSRKRTAYEAWLTDDEGAFVALALDGGEVLGYALVRSGGGYDGWRSDERVAVLEALSVLPESRGRGVGRRLLEACAGRLREEGVNQVKVQVVEENRPAHRFYARHGFDPVIRELFAPVGVLAIDSPEQPADPPWAADYELQVASWVYQDTQAILSRMAMLVGTDSVFLALTLRDLEKAATPVLADVGAAVLVLAIGVLLIGARQRWGIPVHDARQGRRPSTLQALSTQTAARAAWVSRNKAQWMHAGAILTAVGVLLVALGFLVEL